ncbi:type II secretion system F family protein [Marinobacter sp. F4216]|uniref:type II secretion system F family protein n=1 Tax=Marinobacter sp. F4216 TaxID=2874281 RepID=UPI001CBE89CE|nr:type II secretion system F family protein [Marinobacter sp. F4216]MBZ2168914.1 type II secretion system F family protein [Marinobacter sp. F4216]
MDFLVGLINDFTQNETYSAFGIYVIAGVAGLSLAIAVQYFVSGVYSPRSKRVGALVSQGESYQQELKGRLEGSLTFNHKKTFLGSFSIGGDEVKRTLIQAGFHNDSALAIYNGVRIVLVLFSLVAVYVFLRAFPDLSKAVTMYAVAGFLGIAFLLPSLVLDRIASNRKSLMRRGFPDALDLLVVCCESGLTLMGALQRVAGEIKLSHFELAHELDLVCKKVRGGISLERSLAEFSERTGLEDIRGLNGAITQSIRLGTGIAETLKIYAEELRDKRQQAAEEKAAKLGVKMIFPTIFCIWPSFFIVAVGPSILKVAQVWDKAF